MENSSNLSQSMDSVNTVPGEEEVRRELIVIMTHAVVTLVTPVDSRLIFVGGGGAEEKSLIKKCFAT